MRALRLQSITDDSAVSFATSRHSLTSESGKRRVTYENSFQLGTVSQKQNALGAISWHFAR